MSNQESLYDLWNFLKFSEKQRLMKQFRKLHGNHYTKVDFLNFLTDHYKGLKVGYNLLDGRMIDGKSNR